jgi:predicted DNA-binding transcriptional regulator AlpA
MKKNAKIGILSMVLAIVALLAAPGMNIANADHGGDNGNRGRGNSKAPATVVTAQTVSNSTGTGTVMMQNTNSKGDDNEGQNEDNNNNNNAALEARIQALETQVQQLSARVLVLEQKAGIVDVTAPVISGAMAANIAPTTADVTWTTNEPSTSKVYFSTTTPVNLATAVTVTDPALVMNHSLHLTGLTANTTYHFIVESADASNNVSRSAELSFVTVVADVTAPVISATTATNIAQTVADISWATNEPATSKVYFSTSTPVNIAIAQFVDSASLVISHALHLTGLTANTTYHYIVESKDASNNTALSPEQSFATSL